MSDVLASQSNPPQSIGQLNWLKIFRVATSCGCSLMSALFGLAMLVLTVGVGFYAFQESQQSNQIIRPDPNAPPVPVVRDLSTFVAELSKVKALCEGRASEAKEFIRRHGVEEREARIGQRHYTDLHSELNGCIDHLRSGLVTRFTNDDPRKISERFEKAGQKVNAFLAWLDTLDRPMFGAADPLDVVRELYLKWLEAVRKANDEAIKQLREDLDRCRLKSWQEVN